ncbi:MAG: exo-alpha-sialidase [Saprospiraceae bacterium]|nr:exo-alpha-sialidase [Saprospiraceae bacterium]
MKSQFSQIFVVLMLPLLLVIYSHSINDSRRSGNTKSIVWDANENNMTGYRIPSIVITPNETVLAFAEERAIYVDQAPKSLVLKRSIDQGKTWSSNIYIEKSTGEYWSEHHDEIDPRDAQDKKEVWMNTAPSIDAKSGTVFFFYALNEGSVAGQNLQRYTKLFYKSSHDDGLTWSTRTEVTYLLNCKQDGSPNKGRSGAWNTEKNGFSCDFLGRAFHLPGPGHGIQLSDGRLLIPIWSRTALATFNAQSLRPVSERKYGLRTIYSDDHGATWKAGKAFGHYGLNMNESRIVELDNGDLYINARYSSNDPKTNNHRITGLSKDRGRTWTALQIDKNFAFF